MSITSFIGFDDKILYTCSKSEINAHRLIAWMMVINLIVFCLGIFHFFNISVKSNWLLYFIVFFITGVFLATIRMVIATHDHDLAYFYYHNKLENFKLGISSLLRFLLLIIFALLAGMGYLFWTTEALTEDVIFRLSNGFYDHQPELIRILSIRDDNYHMLDNVTDRLKLLKLIFGPWRFFMVIPFLLVSFSILLPFYMKMYIHQLSNGEYEKKETELEVSIVVSEYYYTWDVINRIRKEKYGLPAIRYESYWDPPFNQKRRYPPLEIRLTTSPIK